MKQGTARWTACAVALAVVLAGCTSGGSGETTATETGGDAGTPEAAGTETAGSFNATGLPVVNDTIQLRIPIIKAHYHNDINEMVTIQSLEEKTNIDVEWEQVPSESWSERKNLMFASGEYPDAFFNGLTTQDVVNYGSQGVLIPLEDLIDQYAPNIKKIFDENPRVRQMATAPDGHIYSVPWFEDKSFFEYRNTFLINKTWLDALGLQVPTTTDELIDVLKAFKERDPNGNGQADEIPATFRHNTTTQGYYELYGAFGLADALTGFSVRDGKVVFEPTLPEYKEAIAFLHRLYGEGLIDPETFTQNSEQLISKTKSETPIVGLIASFNGTYELGDRVGEYVAVPALKGPNGDQLWRRQDNRIILNFFSITSANEHPEATMRLVDTMNEPRTALEFKMGPFGTHMREKDNGMIEVLPPQEGMDTSHWIGSVTPSTALPLLVSKEWIEKIEKTTSDQLRQSFYEIYKPHIVPEEMTYPNMYVTEEQNQRLSVLGTDIMTYVRQTEARWIVEGGVEQDWEKYLQDLTNMGLSEMMDIKQAAYDTFRNN